MAPGDLVDKIFSLEEQVTILKAERDEARRDLKQFSGIHTSVNEAINRGGIFCAITFAEAIDQIVAERNEARAKLDASNAALVKAIAGWHRCATCVIESGDEIDAELNEIAELVKVTS